MKKTLRKLSLSRETLRALNNAGLGRAAGGTIVQFTQVPCPVSADTGCTGPNSCECTFGCNTIPCTTA